MRASRACRRVAYCQNRSTGRFRVTARRQLLRRGVVYLQVIGDIPNWLREHHDCGASLCLRGARRPRYGSQTYREETPASILIDAKSCLLDSWKTERLSVIYFVTRTVLLTRSQRRTNFQNDFGNETFYTLFVTLRLLPTTCSARGHW